MTRRFVLLSFVVAAWAGVACVPSDPLCIACASDQPTLETTTLRPPLPAVTIVAGGLWWLPARGDTWALSGVFDVDVRPVDTVVTTRTFTALRVPSDVAVGSRWAARADGALVPGFEAEVVEGERAVTNPALLELTFVGREPTTAACAPSRTPGCDPSARTSEDDLLTFAAPPVFDDVVLDLWTLPAQDPRDEDSERIGELVIVPDEWRGDRRLLISLADASLDVALRLRSLVDGSVGGIAVSRVLE